MAQANSTAIDYGDVPQQWRDQVRGYIEDGVPPSQEVQDVLECSIALCAKPSSDPARAVLTSWLFYWAPALCHGTPALVANWISLGGAHKVWGKPAAEPAPRSAAFNLSAATNFFNAAVIARRVQRDMPAESAFSREFRAFVADFKSRHPEASSEPSAAADAGPTLEQLRNQLREAEAAADPFFGHSEDSRVYHDGLRAQNKINALRLQISQKERGL